MNTHEFTAMNTQPSPCPDSQEICLMVALRARLKETHSWIKGVHLDNICKTHRNILKFLSSSLITYI